MTKTFYIRANFDVAVHSISDESEDWTMDVIEDDYETVIELMDVYPDEYIDEFNFGIRSELRCNILDYISNKYLDNDLIDDYDIVSLDITKFKEENTEEDAMWDEDDRRCEDDRWEK